MHDCTWVTTGSHQELYSETGTPHKATVLIWTANNHVLNKVVAEAVRGDQVLGFLEARTKRGTNQDRGRKIEIKQNQGCFLA